MSLLIYTPEREGGRERERERQRDRETETQTDRQTDRDTQENVYAGTATKREKWMLSVKLQSCKGLWDKAQLVTRVFGERN